MKTVLLLSLFISSFSWAVTPQEFNHTLMEGVQEDIKQDRYHQPQNTKAPSRGPASVQRDEEFQRKEFLKKNKVNGLYDKW